MSYRILLINWQDIAAYRRPGDYGYSPFVTWDRVHKEIVNQQQLLLPIDVEIPGNTAQVFRVADR